ncbi:TIGR03084 family metal-binding protein [Nonomuraea sediminis]|uniref:TIGR03084 family metal-binding protein n=1 Tax=Nonomuraea sediminis TaxID=2835864 RepID=UPI001BDC3E06|nr:TIGR03084 family metal-binding protein [Nonomuraea sediminis]
MAELVADLRAETASLETLLRPLRPEQWETPTPAEGWAIRDQVSHLAWFDDAARTAVTDPDAFAAAGLTSPDDIAAEHRSMPAADLHAWFTSARASLADVLAGLDARTRIPWYGPPMSAASFATARLMETWAHGQDVADALGVTREPTARLRHVATIGFRAMPYGFAVRNLPVPQEQVRVELVMPDGQVWSAGPQDAGNVVRGPMLDFCLLVTQRVHLADTSLEVTGETAGAWAAIAQAFAGPPGKGRAPGKDQGHSG